MHIDGLQYGQIKLMSTIDDAEVRLARLHEIHAKQLDQPTGSVYQMEITCALIPDVILAHSGYHQESYQRFTMNLSSLKVQLNPLEPCSSRVTQRSSSSDHILFQLDCIFSNSESRTKVKVRGSWMTKGMSSFEKDGWKTVQDVAGKKQAEKLLTRIRGQDLFACEVKYHQLCRTRSLQDLSK